MRSGSFQNRAFPFQLCTHLGIHVLPIPTIADLGECSLQPVLPAVDVAKPGPPPLRHFRRKEHPDFPDIMNLAPEIT